MVVFGLSLIVCDGTWFAIAVGFVIFRFRKVSLPAAVSGSIARDLQLCSLVCVWIRYIQA